MAPALLEQLKTVVTEVTRSENQDAVGASWAALVTEKDPQGRSIGALMVKVGGKRRRDVGGAGTGVCMVTHLARVWINRVRLPVLHVVS